jgi:crotonyl-CoA carboxylase/reductase
MSATHVRHLTVRDVMHPGIVSCTGDARAAEVARMMVDRGVHCIAVVGPAQDGSGAPRVWGIVSDLDVLSALTRPGPSAKAAELASQPVITVRPTLALDEAVEAMVRYGAHHVVVTDPERRTPVGVLSTLDVAAVLGGRRPPAGPTRASGNVPSDRAAEIGSMLRDRAFRNP